MAERSTLTLRRGALLSATNLRVSYGSTPALRGASIDVGEGEIVALVGPSGSGKSTMLLCLAGISVPDDGTVEFDGRAVSGLSDAARTHLRRLCFGFVMQFGHLVPDLSVCENRASTRKAVVGQPGECSNED